MRNLPSVDYVPQIHAVVQKVVIDNAPAEVKALYADPDTREYLNKTHLGVRLGNKDVPMWRRNGDVTFDGVMGLKTDRFIVRMDDNTERLPEDGLYYKVIAALSESELVSKYFEQQNLRDSVSKRLEANLDASKTFKQLYVNLEPELHHYIPKDEAGAQVPACVAPVVDDLRKLGAVLPDTPKAAG
jgi:hypothetical protein